MASKKKSGSDGVGASKKKGGILDTLSGLPSLPSINGGDAGPADAYLGSGDIDLSARFSAPFIFGGSGKGVNTALTGYTMFGIIAVIGISVFFLFRRWRG